MQIGTKDRRRFDPNNLKARDVLIIVPAVLFVSALFVAFAFLVSHDTYIRWGGLGLDTAVLFTFFLYHSRQFLRKQRFWLLTASLLIVHLAAWAALLSQVDEWKLAWFTIMVLEVPVFFYLRDWPGRISS